MSGFRNYFDTRKYKDFFDSIAIEKIFRRRKKKKIQREEIKIKRKERINNSRAPEIHSAHPLRSIRICPYLRRHFATCSKATKACTRDYEIGNGAHARPTRLLLLARSGELVSAEALKDGAVRVDMIEEEARLTGVGGADCQTLVKRCNGITSGTRLETEGVEIPRPNIKKNVLPFNQT